MKVVLEIGEDVAGESATAAGSVGRERKEVPEKMVRVSSVGSRKFVGGVLDKGFVPGKG